MQGKKVNRKKIKNDEELLENFLKLHELTEKIALFGLLCNDLHELIDNVLCKDFLLKRFLGKNCI